MNINKLLESVVRPIRARINAMIGKALVNAVNNTGEIQLIKIQAMEGDVLDDVERVEDYGMTSVPPSEDSEVVYACVAGNRDDVLALKVGHSIKRPKDLDEGDVCYWDIHGNRIWLKKDLVQMVGKEFQIGGETPMARKGDTVVMDTITDSAMVTWIAAVSTVVNGVVPGTIPVVPTTITSEITTGSDTVKGA